MPKRSAPPLLADSLFDLREDLCVVACLSGQVDAQSAGVAHGGRGQVSLDEVAAVLEQLLEQRLGVSVIGAEVSSLLAVLLDPLRNLLKDVGLCACNADVRGGVGSGLRTNFMPNSSHAACMMATRRLMVS